MLSPGAQPSYHHGPHSLLAPVSPVPAFWALPLELPLSRLLLEKHLLPPGKPFPPLQDPGLMHCSLSLRTACWLFLPVRSLPSPDLSLLITPI